MNVMRYTWSELKARTKPHTRARIEVEGRRLSDGLRSEAELQDRPSEGIGGGDRGEPAGDSE
jgi:hypothetical protein